VARRIEVSRFGLENSVIMSEPAFTEKLPGEERVPPVPGHISGPGVRLLVCEATVVASLKADIVKSTGFVHDLDKRDLERLRQITRAAHQKAQPMERLLTDAECDAVIEEIGPQSALATVREGVGITRSIRGRLAEVGARAELRGTPGEGAEVCIWTP
jgi:hypothetical protein